MKFFGVVLLGLLAAPFLAAAPRARGGRWMSITPTVDLSDWTRVPIPPTRQLGAESQWKIDAGRHVIICAGNGGHEWLRYNHEYGNFVFKVEWRLTKLPRAKYNSGIFVRNNADGSIWYQAQVGSASGGYFFGDNPVGGRLVRFNLHGAVGQNHVKPAGEWNSYTILCKGKALTLWVNGEKQSQFIECNNPKGYLGLEAEGSRIEFRKLTVKPLP